MLIVELKGCGYIYVPKTMPIVEIKGMPIYIICTQPNNIISCEILVPRARLFCIPVSGCDVRPGSETKVSGTGGDDG